MTIAITSSGISLDGPLVAGEKVAVTVSGLALAAEDNPTLALLARFPDALLASVELAESETAGTWTGELDTATKQTALFFATARADERRDAALELVAGRVSLARLTVPMANSALCPKPDGSPFASPVYVPVPGPPGTDGTSATVAVGETTTLPAGSPATVENVGTSSAAILNFGIPQGNTGAAATVDVGTTTTLAPGSSATVTNGGTTSAAVFNFAIPKGDKGDPGYGLVAVGVTATDHGTVTLSANSVTKVYIPHGIYFVFLRFAHTDRGSGAIYVVDLVGDVNTKCTIVWTETVAGQVPVEFSGQNRTVVTIARENIPVYGDDLVCVSVMDENTNPRYAFASQTPITSGTSAIVAAADRAINDFTVATGITSLTITPPAAVTGRARDFFCRVTLTDSSLPTVTLSGGTIDIGSAEVAGMTQGVNLLMFTEIASGHWLASRRSAS